MIEDAVLFPEGWADQILVTPAVGDLVKSGDPEIMGPANADLAEEALEGDKKTSLGSFLSAAPIFGESD